MGQRIEHTGSFAATDAAGHERVIRVYKTFHDKTTFGMRSRQYSEGLTHLRDDDGQAINRISKGVYETLDGVRLTSTDPNAP